jgi:phosphoribosylaminoimidazole-succinocarboxamide synthase
LSEIQLQYEISRSKKQEANVMVILGDTDFINVKSYAKGKVRVVYDVGNGMLLIVTRDRISAFDVVLEDLIPGKGIVLNELARFWFGIADHIIANHFITGNVKQYPQPFCNYVAELTGRSMLVKKLDMILIECIVRGYITGSGWESYKKEGAVCGIQLPSGLLESQKLPEPIFTPTTKATQGHDENITFDQLVGFVGKELAEKLRAKSIQLYNYCAEYALKRGIIIADTKFEFGLDERGELVLADEVLTPDSSRFWPLDDYEVGRGQRSFDKQYVRDWLKQSGWDKKPPAPKLPEEVIAMTSKKYIEAYKQITGKEWSYN